MNKLKNRRDLFLTAGRGACLGILGVVAGILTVNRQIDYTDQACTHQGMCRGCGGFTDCRRPQAISARKVKEPGVK